jgi:hypothetical protein
VRVCSIHRTSDAAVVGVAPTEAHVVVPEIAGEGAPVAGVGDRGRRIEYLISLEKGVPGRVAGKVVQVDPGTAVPEVPRLIGRRHTRIEKNDVRRHRSRDRIGGIGDPRRRRSQRAWATEPGAPFRIRLVANWDYPRTQQLAHGQACLAQAILRTSIAMLEKPRSLPRKKRERRG